MNLELVFDLLSHKGVQIIKAICQAITKTSVAEVARATGYRKTQIRHWQWLWTICGEDAAFNAASQHELSLGVVEELVRIVNRGSAGRDRVADFVALCPLVAGLDADSARAVAREKLTHPTGAKPDFAHMHTTVEADGKRRLVARLRDDRASEIDRILHRKAQQLMQAGEKIPYSVAYANALCQVILQPDPTGPSDATIDPTTLAAAADSDMSAAMAVADSLAAGGHRPLFAPLFVIPTDCHYYDDGRIVTAAGATMDLEQVVNEPLADTGYAAVMAKNVDNIPQIVQLVPVRYKGNDRLASPIIRLISTIMNLRCVRPGCDRAAVKCHQHHVVSWKFGGTTRIENMVPLCATDNGLNDDDPNAKPKNGRIEFDPQTGTPGLRRRPDEPLEFNPHPTIAKGMRAFATEFYNLAP